MSHFSVLNHLVRLGDGKTPLSLANAFQVTKATMMHTLATLSKRRFVKILPHETDGRSKVVYLTEEGALFQQQAIESLAPTIQAFGDKIDWEQVKKMLPELQKIREVLDENRDI